jgi:hypothetical protein
MKKTMLSFFLATLAPALSWGDVEAFNHPLASGQVYTVPAGKVLLLEAGAASTTGTGTLSIRTPGSSFAFSYSTNTSLPTSGNPRQPLYLKEGTTLGTTGEGRDFVIFGRLATPDELYASSEPTSEIDISGGSARVVFAETKSKWPVRFALQESTDLVSWIKAAVSSITTTRSTVSANLPKSADEKSKFVRAVAKEIPVGAGG